MARHHDVQHGFRGGEMKRHGSNAAYRLGTVSHQWVKVGSRLVRSV
jgi:hypothetical protein